jgi:hypothetical protein
MLRPWSALTVCMHACPAAVCAGMQGLLCRCWLGGWPAQLGSSQGARSRRGRGAGCSQQVPQTTSHLLSPTLSARSRPANHWHAAGQLRKELQLIQLAHANSQQRLLQPQPAGPHSRARWCPCRAVAASSSNCRTVPACWTGPVTDSLQLSLGLRWPPLLDKEAAAAGKK